MKSALIIICFYYIGFTFGQDLDISVYRLPNSITPLHYAINLRPQLMPPFSLEGEVLIKFQTSQDPIDEIVLHLGEELQLVESNVSLVDGTNITIKLGAIDNDEPNQMVSIKTNASLSPVSLYTIILPFKGSLRTDGKGLYVGSFKDTPDMYYLSSNFYPIQARLAFPCFDEPSFKATFDMTIIRPERYSAVFNSPVKEIRRIGNGMISETFSTTPKMAVHSLSLFIGNVTTTSFLIESINLTIIHQGLFPIGLSDNVILQNIISFTDNLLSYSLNSTKIILLPNINSTTIGGFRVLYFNDDFFDFSSLTITESLERFEIFLDKLLKQYFNFAVTPRWWSEIWLSEGVSTYLQYVIMDRIVTGLPNFYPSKMLISIRHKVLKHDISSRPLADDSIQSPQQILSVVSDDLKKYKGALILTMLELSLPAGTLMVTLNNYLSQKLYGTATTADFINILNTTLKINGVTVNLGSWFYESGYPLVSVKKKTNIILTQEKFCEFGTQCQNSSSWEIPITFMTKNKADYKWIETEPEEWLGLEPLTMKDYTLFNNSWVILNNQAQGYYRINYNKDDLMLIKEMLSDASNFNNKNIDSKMSRGQIVDDVMALAAQGLVNYSIALDIVSCYKRETNYFVLTSVFSSLNLVETVLYREAEYKEFQVYVTALVEGISQSFTTLDSLYMYSLSNALLIPWFCVANITITCNSYTQIAEEFINGKYDWLETVSNIEFHEYMCAGVRYNNGTIFQNLTIAYQTSMNTPYHQYFVTGVGCITNKNNLNSVLQNITQQQTSFIAKEDIKFILSRMTSLIENTDEVMDLIATKAKFLEDLYGEELVANIILDIEEKLTKEVHADQLFRISTTANLSSTVIEMANLTLLRLKTRISLISSLKIDIMKYFNSHEELTTLQPIIVSTTNLPTTTLPFTNSSTTTSSSVTSSVTCNSTTCPSSSARNNIFSLSIFYITFCFVFLNLVLFKQM